MDMAILCYHTSCGFSTLNCYFCKRKSNIGLNASTIYLTPDLSLRYNTRQTVINYRRSLPYFPAISLWPNPADNAGGESINWCTHARCACGANLVPVGQ